MITGFNTDVRRGEVVFHVQTEDKGLHNPCIESLVYVGGQILARKRAGYRSLLLEGRGKQDIARLMERQHQLLIDEIQGGQLDERLQELRGERPAAEPEAEGTGGEVAERAASSPEAGSETAGETGAAQSLEVESGPTPTAAAAGSVEEDGTVPGRAHGPDSEEAAVAGAETMGEEAAEAGPAETPAATSAESATEAPGGGASTEPAIVEPSTAEPPPVAPHSAVSEAHRPTSAEGPRTLDQVILDYLEAEAEQERLVLSMETAEGQMSPGSEVVLLFHAGSSADGRGVEGARITVQMISTRKEPRLLGSGLTDDGGALELRVSIPGLEHGSAAILVAAESELGDAEVKQLI